MIKVIELKTLQAINHAVHTVAVLRACALSDMVHGFKTYLDTCRKCQNEI